MAHASKIVRPALAPRAPVGEPLSGLGRRYPGPVSTTTFEVSEAYRPTGDQPRAIGELTAGLERGERFQTLLGVTGSGKTFTMARAIAGTGRPALVIAHNKTLAAQLCNEFRELLPGAAVEYFVSYYDYYQPEAYIAATGSPQPFARQVVVIRSRIGRTSVNFVGLMMTAARRTGVSGSSPERKWPRGGRGRRRRSGAVASGATRFMMTPPMTNASTTIPATIHGR